MKITLSVDIGEGPFIVTTNFYNVIEWERKYKRRASELAQGIGAEDLAFLAFQAARSAGHVIPLMFDDFAKKLVSLDVISEEPANPSQPAPGAAA